MATIGEVFIINGAVIIFGFLMNFFHIIFEKVEHYTTLCTWCSATFIIPTNFRNLSIDTCIVGTVAMNIIRWLNTDSLFLF